MTGRITVAPEMVPVPVTVTVAVPTAAVVEAVSVSTLLVPVTVPGLNAAVTPAGNPLALSMTAPVNPPVRVMVIVLVPDAPTLMLRVAGLADKAKSGV